MEENKQKKKSVEQHIYKLQTVLHMTNFLQKYIWETPKILIGH